MDFSSPVTLENNRALLRLLTAADADALAIVAADAELWRYTLTRAEDRASLDAYVAAALQSREQGLRYPFLIFDKATGEAAGSTSYYNVSADERRLSIGYTWIGRTFQRTGLNRAAKHLLLRYAFEELGYERVELETDARNHKSQEAMRRMGATQEGTLRNHRFTQGGLRRDTVIFSIIKPEWDTLRQTVFHDFYAHA